MGISLDMKYTALYWALRFVEKELDVHTKSYNGYEVTIYAEDQYVDFGDKINGIRKYPLTEHEGFVVLECVDRLFNEGYLPEEITICKGHIITIKKGKRRFIIECQAWDGYRGIGDVAMDFDYEIIYTSRLVSGLLEYKAVASHGAIWDYYGVGANKQCNNIFSEYEIIGTELVSYNGKDKLVIVPEGIETIGASAFWNNTYVEEIVLPQSLKRLGGDCFYYCTNLEKVTIPRKVWIMGNNPFAGCPRLCLKNESEHFILEDGVLYDKDKSMIIYYPIRKGKSTFEIPEGVTCIGKHCFFSCDNLEKIVIPKSVIKLENNPFSGCTRLQVENHSPYYHFDNGVIYNKYKTTIIGCLNGVQIDCLEIPDTVSLISRNSFWNCNGIKRIVIGKNVNRIGYNPFAGCTDLLLESKSLDFPCEDGIIFNKDKTQLLCATNKAVGQKYRAPNGVKSINRGVFSGCKDLKEIDFNQVTYIDKSSFTSCSSLESIYIPDGVTYVGEWTFSYCMSLKHVSISKNTKIDRNAFNECPATIERR